MFRNLAFVSLLFHLVLIVTSMIVSIINFMLLLTIILISYILNCSFYSFRDNQRFVGIDVTANCESTWFGDYNVRVMIIMSRIQLLDWIFSCVRQVVRLTQLN